MSLWMVRAGSHGEYEPKFLEESQLFLTWDDLNRDLSHVKTKGDLRSVLEEIYPDAPKGRITNHLGQIWAFSHKIKIGDWIVLPSKLKPAIHFAEVTGTYQHEDTAENPFYHTIAVKWIETDVPRSSFDQDLLYSFGAFMTVCEVKRNKAEQRIQRMAKAGWTRVTSKIAPLFDKSTDDDGDIAPEAVDLEQAALDQIAHYIIAKFKGHGMARLIDAILRAQGYTTHVSPPGPDKGIDVLAAPGPLGFGTPRICVQVKSGDTPLDRPTLDQLIGVMQNVQAEQGLLVSWGGFKVTVDKEKASQFFRVRLWDQKDIIEQLLAHYDKLDDELRAELPLKQIWTISEGDQG